MLRSETVDDTHRYFNKKKLHVDHFFTLVRKLGLENCWPSVEVANKHNTVFNARTFCQTQLNKAIRRVGAI
jgi:hypothetical protein